MSSEAPKAATPASSSPAPGTAPGTPPKGTDVLIVHGPTADGEGVNVLRARDRRIELGEMRPLKEGKPITGEVVQLTARAGAPNAFDVEVLAKVTGPALAAAGPAQVATREYRDGWDRVFGDPAPTADRSLN
jgi:hypothetical protein